MRQRWGSTSIPYRNQKKVADILSKEVAKYGAFGSVYVLLAPPIHTSKHLWVDISFSRKIRIYYSNLNGHVVDSRGGKINSINPC